MGDIYSFSLFANLADQIYGKRKNEIVESYSWYITNSKGDVEKFSGFNAFYGVGSKMGSDQREKRLQKISEKYKSIIPADTLKDILDRVRQFLLEKAKTAEDREQKVLLRNSIEKILIICNNKELSADILKLIYRPKDELYIPIPNARQFHESHPHFFGPNIGTFVPDSKKLVLPKKQCEFDLVFEPSGDEIRAFITQDHGKAIESVEKQSYLGEWILKGVFQLNDLEPLTVHKLNEIGINGIRLYKTAESNKIHLQFIWIDHDNKPKDFIN